MPAWFGLAIAAAVLYGLHQVFTKLASARIGAGLGAFVVEASAALTILAYLAVQRLVRAGSEPVSAAGLGWSVLTGVSVGAGTVIFFLLFQRGGPLSAVPIILAGGAALMVVVGIGAFREPASASRLAGIACAVAGLYLLQR